MPVITVRKRRIPKVPKDKLVELSKRIHPTVRFFDLGKEDAEGDLFYIEDVNPFTISYVFDPKPTVMATGLAKICDITTYHIYGYKGFFKPSIAEVLAQIPEEHLEKVIAFEIIQWPKVIKDLLEYRKELIDGYHVATTRLYSTAE